ncbi:MAG: CoA transferase [Chloroflexota bacterium]
MNSILNGIRVLDFGRFIAGPYCAALLGQMGADVIRIERPGGGEDRFLAPITDLGEGGMFMQVNTNKQGLTLDITSEKGREIVRQLVKTADVVVANMPPEVLTALGLDYETLSSLKEDIILVANSAFGNQTPYANQIGFDGIAQAMSGTNFYSGKPGKPMRTAVPYIDFSTALSATLGTLAALMARQKTGKGQLVETSLLGTGLTIANSLLIEQAVIDANRVPTGNQGQIAAPADLFKTKDGHIVVQIVGPYIYKRWAKLMGDPSLLTDERFKDDISRGNNSQIVNDIMSNWTMSRTTEEAMVELAEARIPSGPVLSIQQSLDDPRVQALGHLKPVEYPGAPRPAPIADIPFQLSETAVGVTQRAPTIGEHNQQILSELGYSDADIAKLVAEGIL